MSGAIESLERGVDAFTAFHEIQRVAHDDLIELKLLQDGNIFLVLRALVADEGRLEELHFRLLAGETEVGVWCTGNHSVNLVRATVDDVDSDLCADDTGQCRHVRRHVLCLQTLSDGDAVVRSLRVFDKVPD